MRIIQILPTLCYGDGIGNYVLELKDILDKKEYTNFIYSGYIDNVLIKKGGCFPFDEIPTLKEDDVLIYHMSIGSEISKKIESFACRKIMIYHNITPPHFFYGYSKSFVTNTSKGREDLIHLSDKFDYCLADSEYNKQELIQLGYKCTIDVLPILINFEDFRQQPNRKLMTKYLDDKINLLFVGRIAPNKAIQDVIRAFYHYKTKYNYNSRLFLVGSTNGMEAYYSKLREYIASHLISDIIMLGHCSFEDILAYYHIADCFVCMSEHEGFCIPLVEAMFFDLPIIAYNSSAISGTLGSAGFLLQQKDPIITASAIHHIMSTPSLRKQILQEQRKRLSNFTYDTIKDLFSTYIDNFISATSK